VEGREEEEGIKLGGRERRERREDRKKGRKKEGGGKWQK
jgi:hypothetical protein